jgi:hypothetical protein
LKYKILKELLKSGYVKQIKKDFYCKINGWLPIAKEVVAVEAKLKDWKRGFYQANRYKAFADKVYVAIPPQAEHLVNKKILRDFNVGLIVFDLETGTKREVIRAKTVSPANTYKKNYALEFFWNRGLALKLT